MIKQIRKAIKDIGIKASVRQAKEFGENALCISATGNGYSFSNEEQAKIREIAIDNKLLSSNGGSIVNQPMDKFEFVFTH